MNIAFLNSGEKCAHCGRHEPILIARGSTPLERDITGLIAAHMDRRERELVALWEEEKVSLHELMQSEGAALKAKLAAEHEKHDQALEELLGQRARFWRPFKRRWQRQLESEVAAVIADLREQTRRA